MSSDIIKRDGTTAITGRFDGSLKEFEEFCKENGLEVQEATRKELIQTISIQHDPLDGKLTWSTENINGVATMGLMAEAFISMYEQFSGGPMRADLGTGSAKIAVIFENGQMRIVAEPHGNNTAVKRILAMALAYYVSKGAGNPLDEFGAAFGWSDKS